MKKSLLLWVALMADVGAGRRTKDSLWRRPDFRAV
jgi:hypothetical protein